MVRFLLVCLGSALGGGLRYLVALGAPKLFGERFPYATLAVNVVGSFLISGLMFAALEARVFSPEARLFLTTGIMGGLTTYSTFNYETLKLFESGARGVAALNVGVTLVACLAAGWLGALWGRWAWGAA